MKRGLLSLGVVFLFIAPARANLVGSPRQMSEKTWDVQAFYQGVQAQHLNFALAGDGTCANRTGAVTFPCGGTGNVKGGGNGGAAILKLSYQPYESMQYYAAFGAGDYSLKVNSLSLTGERPGQLYQFGVKAILFPDTVAAPGLAADLSFGWQKYWFNEARPARDSLEGQIDQRLDIMQTQLAVETGHLFKKKDWRVGVEPYGGVKWVRMQAWLKDRQGGGRAGGIKDALAPFLGVNLQIYEKETLFAEASFVNGWQYGAGISIRFK